MFTTRSIRIIFLAAAGLWLFATSVRAADVRIKDITDVEGVRINQLTGVGLVTGLNGTGGRNPATREFALNLLQRFGLRAAPDVRANLRTDSQIRTDNISVVTVTAELPTVARQGSRIDVRIAALDDATSLQGGELILTPLFGVDGEVYALASGPVSIGGFSFGADAASVTKNHPTSGRIPNGAVVELETASAVGDYGFVRLLLRHPDFETARRIAAAINGLVGDVAHAVDPGTVEIVTAGLDREQVLSLVADVGQLTVEPDAVAVVVINERTGTIVMGEHVKLSAVAITHANLAVTTAEFPQVSQPAPFSDGETVVVPRSDVEVFEEISPVNVFEDAATVGDLARALNALGVTPRDMSAIFQKLKIAGALHAELRFE